MCCVARSIAKTAVPIEQLGVDTCIEGEGETGRNPRHTVYTGGGAVAATPHRLFSLSVICRRMFLGGIDHIRVLAAVLDNIRVPHRPCTRIALTVRNAHNNNAKDVTTLDSVYPSPLGGT